MTPYTQPFFDSILFSHISHPVSLPLYPNPSWLSTFPFCIPFSPFSFIPLSHVFIPLSPFSSCPLFPSYIPLSPFLLTCGYWILLSNASHTLTTSPSKRSSISWNNSPHYFAPRFTKVRTWIYILRFGFASTVELYSGNVRTYNWYENQREPFGGTGSFMVHDIS